jgi:hypothetical protein
MTRQVFIGRCVVGVLASIVFPMAAWAQQTQAAPSPKAPANVAAASTSHNGSAHTRSTSHHSRHRRHRYAGSKRMAYRPEFHEHSVQVINGATTQNVVFKDDPKPDAKVKGQSAQMKVEVLNGTQKDTQYFLRNDNQPGADAARLKQPVVVGIQSSDTRIAGGNKHPVVTGITASGSSDAKSIGSGGQKVATQIAPRPKRHAYQSDSH